MVDASVFLVEDGVHPVQSLCVFVKPVVGQLISHKKEDQNSSGQADCQAQNINRWKDFLFRQVAHSNFEIVFKHDTNLRIQLNSKKCTNSCFQGYTCEFLGSRHEEVSVSVTRSVQWRTSGKVISTLVFDHSLSRDWCNKPETNKYIPIRNWISVMQTGNHSRKAQWLWGIRRHLSGLSVRDVWCRHTHYGGS